MIERMFAWLCQHGLHGTRRLDTYRRKGMYCDGCSRLAWRRG